MCIDQVKNTKKRPLLTAANSRLYCQGPNPLLVKLDQFNQVPGKFSKAYLQFSDEFNEVIEANKKVLRIENLSKKEALVPVIWKKNTPYAFLNVKIPANSKRPTIDFCDIVEGYEVGSWAPVDSELPKQPKKVRMNIQIS